eukprot:751339-Hanusia_phi.AAC.2
MERYLQRMSGAVQEPMREPDVEKGIGRNVHTLLCNFKTGRTGVSSASPTFALPLHPHLIAHDVAGPLPPESASLVTVRPNRRHQQDLQPPRQQSCSSDTQASCPGPVRPATSLQEEPRRGSSPGGDFSANASALDEA